MAFNRRVSFFVGKLWKWGIRYIRRIILASKLREKSDRQLQDIGVERAKIPKIVKEWL